MTFTLLTKICFAEPGWRNWSGTKGHWTSHATGECVQKCCEWILQYFQSLWMYITWLCSCQEEALNKHNPRICHYQKWVGCCVRITPAVALWIIWRTGFNQSINEAKILHTTIAVYLAAWNTTLVVVQHFCLSCHSKQSQMPLHCWFQPSSHLFWSIALHPNHEKLC